MSRYDPSLPPPPTQRCPRCAAEVESHPGYVSWCECGWNLESRREPRTGPLARAYDRLDVIRGDSLFEDAKRGTTARASTREGFVQVLCMGIVATTPVTGVVGAILSIVAPRNPLAWFLGLALVWASWILRPRVDALDDTVTVAKVEVPELWALVGEVAAAIHVDPPKHLILTPDYNACARSVGVGREPVLELGVPLMATLDPQERVALIGHELAHFASGDPARGRWFVLALETLQGWASLWRAPGVAYWDPRRTEELLGGIVAEVFVWIPRSIATMLGHLTYDESQRAEYRADRIGATVSGTPAFLGLLRGLAWGRCYSLAVHRTALGGVDQDVVPCLVAMVKELPERERRRLLLVDERSGSRVDDSHPPTAFRIRALEATDFPAKVVVDEQRHRAVQAELESYFKPMGRELVRRYRASLY